MPACCPAGDDGCEVAGSGSVTFESYEAGVSATGTWTLVFGDDEISGSFDAPFCEDASAEICG